MNQQKLKTLINLWNSQGLFKGDINRVQQYCLSYALSEDRERGLDILKIETLAANPEVYRALFEPMADIDDSQEWQTLSGEQEEDLIAELQRWQSQRESA